MRRGGSNSTFPDERRGSPATKSQVADEFVGRQILRRTRQSTLTGQKPITRLF